MSRVALVGVGGFGAYHLVSINSLVREGRFQLVAAADPCLGEMSRLRQELAEHGTKVYLDYRDLLDKESSCDAVVIAAPIPFHYEMARCCIERGFKVYLEKPSVPLLSQLESLIGIDVESNVFVGFQHLCYPWIRRLKDWICEGRFGTLTDIRVAGCWNRPDSYYRRASWCGKMMHHGRPVFDGPATNALAHVIHSIMYLSSPQHDAFDIPSEVRGELYRARDIQSYDVASLCGQFRSGTKFAVGVTHATEVEFPFEFALFGTEAWARVSGNGRLMETSFSGIEPHDEPQEVLRDSYLKFVEFLEGTEKRPLTTLSDCRGYTIATNGALVSSGGIHTIPPMYCSQYGGGDKTGLAVAGLSDAIMRTIYTGGTLGDLRVPWAVQTRTISRDEIEACDLRSHFADQDDLNNNEASYDFVGRQSPGAGLSTVSI